MNGNVKIDISTRTYVRFLLVLSIFVGSVFLLWRLLPVLQILAISFFLAIALNKPVSRLSKMMPKRSRLLATAVVYVLFVSFLYILFSVALPPTIKQTSILIGAMPGIISNIGQKGGFLADFIYRYNLQSEVNAVSNGIQSQIASYAQGFGSNVVEGVSTLLSGIISLFLILVLTFLILIEGPKWRQAYWQTYTNQATRERHQLLVEKMYHVITGYVNGQVLVAGLAAVMASLTMFIVTTIFGLPISLVLPLAFATFCFELIPVVGPTIGGAIVTGVLAFNSFGAALVYLIYFMVYLQIEANILQPAIQSRTVEISALIVLVSVISGILLLGIPGGILAIPVAGCVRVLVIDYYSHRQKKHQAIKKLTESATV